MATSCELTIKIIGMAVQSQDFGVLAIAVTLCIWMIRELLTYGNAGKICAALLTPFLIFALALAIQEILYGNGHAPEYILKNARNCISQNFLPKAVEGRKLGGRNSSLEPNLDLGGGARRLLSSLAGVDRER
jgi:hypothetical protein